MSALRFSDTEANVQLDFRRLDLNDTQAIKEVLTQYQNLFGFRLRSAHTHYAALQAAQQVVVTDDFIRRIIGAAKECVDYPEVELNFDRYKALRLARHAAIQSKKRVAGCEEAFKDSRTLIETVIDRRMSLGSEQSSEYRSDMVAKMEIEFLSGHTWSASSTLDKILDMPAWYIEGDPISRHIVWLSFSSFVLRRDFMVASLTAKECRRIGVNDTSFQRRVLQITRVPWVGPRITRMLFVREYGF